MKNNFLGFLSHIIFHSILFMLMAPSLGAEPPLSITFADAARLALGASKDLRNEYAQRAIREGAWVWGRRAYFPRMNFSISEDDRLSEISADSFLKNYSVNIDQLLWDGGRTAMGRRIEKAGLNLMGTQLERMAREIAEGAVSAYRSLLFSRAVLEIREAAWESLEEQRRIMAREAELGMVLEMDLIAAGISVAEARLEIISLQLDLTEAERQLAEALGLEKIPLLSEQVDIRAKMVIPSPEMIRSLAEGRNPDLLAARYAIQQKQEELKFASRSWMPNVRFNGTFSLSGQEYPLSRYNWSVGISLDFSSPYFSGSVGAQAGWEPPYDRSARLQNSLSPLPDPGSALNIRSAELALALEKTKYNEGFERLGRTALMLTEKCFLADKKRTLAAEYLDLAAERFRFANLRMELGQITRLELMEERMAYTQREIAAVEAASALLENRRELERFLDLRPGELSEIGGGLTHE